MISRLGFVQQRINAAIAAPSGPASKVTVIWTAFDSLQTDGPTGANLGNATLISGVLRALGFTEPARSVERKFQDIQTGDVILDMGSFPTVSIFPGQLQSGVVPLAAVANDGTRFVWGDKLYAQAKVGEELNAVWDAIAGGLPMSNTLLLRRAV